MGDCEEKVRELEVGSGERVIGRSWTMRMEREAKCRAVPVGRERER